tara:strand:+ start:1973 stop:2134 length:162 start_codon:yes stop_codon:yes gene_type:complete
MRTSEDDEEKSLKRVQMKLFSARFKGISQRAFHDLSAVGFPRLDELRSKIFKE